MKEAVQRWLQRLFQRAIVLPKLDYSVWILILGRLLSQLGTGFTLFYAPIFFVQQVGLSATAVGLGIGSGSITGIIGRILGGTFADSPQFGRRYTLLLSSAIAAVGSFVLAIASDFPSFLIGNLLTGLGVGLYWPATEAVVADLTTAAQRNEAFALTRLGDSLGLGLGVVLGGLLITLTANYRALFVIDAISFLIFFAVIYRAIAETLHPNQPRGQMWSSWGLVLRDRLLLLFSLVNILFTTYLAQVNSTLPLYFSEFVELPAAQGFSTTTISILFAWGVGLTALTQLPVTRALNRFSRPQALMLSALLWGLGFLLVWVTGTVTTAHLFWAGASLAILAIATVAYLPSASALVVSLAPVSLRGVYLSVNSLCWAIGYLIGPSIGGWAMDRPDRNTFWLACAFSTWAAIGLLQNVQRSHRV
jgi:MFS family permease